MPASRQEISPRSQATPSHFSHIARQKLEGGLQAQEQNKGRSHCGPLNRRGNIQKVVGNNLINTIAIAGEYGSGGGELGRPSFREQENPRLNFYRSPKCLVQIVLVLWALGKLWLIDEGFRPGDWVAAGSEGKFAMGLSSLQNPQSSPLEGSDPCV